MVDPLIRGAVVARGERFSVVWNVGVAGLVLLPVLRPRKAERHDVALELADLVATGVTISGAVIRPRANAAVPTAGWTRTGAVPGATMCRVVHGLVRAITEAQAVAKWSDDDRHRRRGNDEQCVNLLRDRPPTA